MMVSSTLSNKTDTSTYVQEKIVLDEDMAKPKDKALFGKENKTYDVFKPSVDKAKVESSRKKIKDSPRSQDLLI